MTEGEAARPRHEGLLALVLVVAAFAYDAAP
jgi:MYXO-CTERM domain-containing protein